MELCGLETAISQTQLYEMSGVLMLTAIIGFIGAALQLRSLRQFKNTQRRRPSANPAIIFYLAISDMIFCVGVCASCILLMIPAEHVSVPIAAITEIVMRFGYVASFVWTFSFALDVCFQLYEIECAMVVYHVLAWAIPVLLNAIIEGANLIHYPDGCRKAFIIKEILLSIACMVVIVANPVMFCVAYRRVKQLFRSSGRYTNDERAALYAYRRRFFLMVIAFIVCWLPLLIFATLYLWTSEKHEMNKSMTTILYFVLTVSPLQGILNYFLYRRAFRVMARDTRREPHLLPRVKRQDSVLDRIRSRILASSNRVNQFVKKDEPSLNQDQETSPLLSSQEENENRTSRYVYTCRLLGE